MSNTRSTFPKIDTGLCIIYKGIATDIQHLSNEGLKALEQAVYLEILDRDDAHARTMGNEPLGPTL